MKLKLLPVFLLPVILICSCAPSMKFDQTCLTCISSQRYSCEDKDCPKTFMIGNECIVTIVETGENIYLNSILEEEGIKPGAEIPIAIAKLNGFLFLTGNGFGNLWRLCPKPGNEAKYKAFDLPMEDIRINNPVFSLDLQNYLLKLTADNFNGKTYIFDDGEWMLESSGKAGE